MVISHLEMDLSVPRERTVTLLARIFKMEPPELVEGTMYPQATAERLPLVSCRYTEVQMQLALLRADVGWLQRLCGTPAWPQAAGEVRRYWHRHLHDLETRTLDACERDLVAMAYDELRAGLQIE